LILHDGGQGFVTIAQQVDGSWRERAIPIADLSYFLRHLDPSLRSAAVTGPKTNCTRELVPTKMSRVIPLDAAKEYRGHGWRVILIPAELWEAAMKILEAVPHRPASMIGFPSAKAPAGIAAAYQRNDRSRAAAALGSANHSGAWQRCPYPVK
jgi:hypothetical protein